MNRTEIKKKRWRPVGSKTGGVTRKPFIDVFKAEREAYIKDLEIGMDKSDVKIIPNTKSDATILMANEIEKYWNELEVPTLRRIPSTQKMSLTDKITWVLTVVNVAILISLVIKNV